MSETPTKVVHHPLSWYTEKLEKHEPFTSLLYGDGEWLVALGERTGQLLQNKEYVTDSLQKEVLDSLKDPDPSIIRGTEPFIVDWHTYDGGDKASIHRLGIKVNGLIGPNPAYSFVDGTIWEKAVREGKLGPLLKVLKTRRPVVVGHPALSGFAGFNRQRFYAIPPQNAYGMIDELFRHLSSSEYEEEEPVFLLCMGLGAIPLAMRLKKQLPLGGYGIKPIPRATFLDLGSTFDIFVGLGQERGWRQELYEDRLRLKDLLEKNLEGS